MPRDLLLIGAYDSWNFGDRLYPLLASMVFPASVTCHPAGLLGWQDSTAAPHPVPKWSDAVKALRRGASCCVLGGDTLQPDTRFLAPLYAQNLALREAVGQWREEPDGSHLEEVKATLDRLSPNRGACGPFFVDPEVVGACRELAYGSVGVPLDIPPTMRPSVRRLMGRASYVWVRDTASCRRLGEAGVSVVPDVAPDIAVLAPEAARAFDLHAPEWPGGADVARRILFQCHGIQTADRAMAWADALAAHAQRTGDAIYLLPLAPVHGDLAVLSNMTARHPQLSLLRPRSVLDTLSYLAAADAFVGTSLHGTMVTFAFGKPFLTLSAAYPKVAAFRDTVGLEPTFALAGANLEAALERLWANEPRRPLVDESRQATWKAVAKLVDAVTC